MPYIPYVPYIVILVTFGASRPRPWVPTNHGSCPPIGPIKKTLGELRKTLVVFSAILAEAQTRTARCDTVFFFFKL